MYICMYVYARTYVRSLGLYDNGKTYILIMLIMHYKIISINDSYSDKIMIGYYAYILDFCNSKIALCTNIFVCFV